ncbi:hypothetical protein EJ08DRAFT_63373 [Tothia fuscella]|uniref:Uncharacterized protein n=1 Tax=Tothia fuscella TaxID=1048955 RepID=A0A9P4NFF1_9PEZI|nr:hypothetical protein EJ08DRAFT_63373 [Tothia fuscella]
MAMRQGIMEHPNRPDAKSMRAEEPVLSGKQANCAEILQGPRVLVNTRKRKRDAVEDPVGAAITKDKPFPFLSLPRELRDRIYVISMPEISYCKATPEYGYFKSGTICLPNITLVNHQTYREGLEAFLKHTTINFSNPNGIRFFTSWLERLNKSIFSGSPKKSIDQQHSPTKNAFTLVHRLHFEKRDIFIIEALDMTRLITRCPNIRAVRITIADADMVTIISPLITYAPKHLHDMAPRMLLEDMLKLQNLRCLYIDKMAPRQPLPIISPRNSVSVEAVQSYICLESWLKEEVKKRKNSMDIHIRRT